jgi:integrase
MTLQTEFSNAMLAAGNKRSSIESYWPHIERFIQHVRSRRGPTISRDDVTIDDVYNFRGYMARRLGIAPKSRNQAISALKFLFERVIGKPFDEKEADPLRARTAKHSRRRLTSKRNLVQFFRHLRPVDRLTAQMQYAGVMRLDDVVNLRLKDLNFDDEQIQIASCKHDHFRIVPFPKSLHDAARRQIESVKVLHELDATENPNGVPVPYAYARKCTSAPRDLAWYWLFPSGSLSHDPADGRLKRYRKDKDNIRKQYKLAKQRAGILGPLTPHDLRRNAATHLHLAGMPLKRLQDILGHNRLEQTRDYILDDEASINGSHSPFDDLPDCAG